MRSPRRSPRVPKPDFASMVLKLAALDASATSPCYRAEISPLNQLDGNVYNVYWLSSTLVPTFCVFMRNLMTYIESIALLALIQWVKKQISACISLFQLNLRMNVKYENFLPNYTNATINIKILYKFRKLLRTLSQTHLSQFVFKIINCAVTHEWKVNVFHAVN